MNKKESYEDEIRCLKEKNNLFEKNGGEKASFMLKENENLQENIGFIQNEKLIL